MNWVGGNKTTKNDAIVAMNERISTSKNLPATLSHDNTMAMANVETSNAETPGCLYNANGNITPRRLANHLNRETFLVSKIIATVEAPIMRVAM